MNEIAFAELDMAAVESAVITAYERIAGVTLYPGDPVRLFLESLAYVVCVQNCVIDMAGKQNLLAYARGDHLDHLGLLMGVRRLAANPARLKLRFSLAAPLEFDVPVPAGVRAVTAQGDATFATREDALIPAGSVDVECDAVSLTPGAAANGLVAGQVCQMIDPLPYIVCVENVSPATGGADVENDERLRERIRRAPESFTVAGSTGAYEARVLEISQDIAIAAVSVTSPEPGHVDVRFLLEGGELPDAGLAARVLAHLSAETVRPLTDFLTVAAPDEHPYAVRGRWYLTRSEGARLASVTSAVGAALERYRLWQRSRPGRDINPTRLISLLEQAGVKRVELDEPSFTRLAPTEVARETDMELLFGGLEEE